MLKKLTKSDVSLCPRGHSETLIKRCGFGRPGKQLPCETLVGSDPRRAAQGKCDFWELPALARILSLRGLLGRVVRVSREPWNMCKMVLALLQKIAEIGWHVMYMSSKNDNTLTLISSNWCCSHFYSLLIKKRCARKLCSRCFQSPKVWKNYLSCEFYFSKWCGLSEMSNNENINVAQKWTT